MKRRRNLAQLEASIKRARTRRAQAAAYYQLGLFHDNNNREAEAIPNYETALRLTLTGQMRARAFAWLASSFYKPAASTLRSDRSSEHARQQGLSRSGNF